MILAGGGGVVLGVGTDLVDIRRIARAVERHGDRFLERIYTGRERALCEARGRVRVESYARRWAAKEAAAKALGLGLVGALEISATWREIEVARAETGWPSLSLSGRAAARAAAMAAGSGLENAAPRLHVSMTDEPPYAQAVVILEAVGILEAVAAAAGQNRRREQGREQDRERDRQSEQDIRDA